MKKLTGTGVALVTPFLANGQIDFPALKKLLKHTAKGVDYYVVMGTTGEVATLNKEERKDVLQFVLNNNEANLPIVYGIGGNNTAEVLKQIEETDFKGVTALLSVSPYYNKPSQAGIVTHFKAVADASPVPVILYNVPGRTGSNMLASTTLTLAQHSNIIGIKEASGNLEQCMKIAAEAPKNFLLISGDDMLTVPLYAIGSKGVISVLANAYPLSFKKMKDFAFANDYRKASKELFTLLDINGHMYEEGNPVGVKQLLAEMNVVKPFVRLPLVPASASLTNKIKSVAPGLRKK
ncbi:MAG: 4-hydroxy-tetrahydrodipicolinate synthase [Cyclobacteriaceae bacterium]|jgi:4-hydroxy-tetrahydrodipicolinate synthase|nr:4-hydroxy-tetrahydrodipicolinate synthase [Cyclobacteriaceae bacterium]